MPQAFEQCRKSGGKIRTVKLSGGRTQPVCTLNGKSYRGYVKGGKSDGRDTHDGGSATAAAIQSSAKKGKY